MANEEFIVVGAGLAGAATAWQLALRGQSVTVLERSTPAHPGGSSHGSARIFRYAYPDQLYTDLVVRARTGWSELERQSGRQLITQTGCVDFGQVRDPRGLAGILTRAGVEHELLSAEQATERWPQLNVDTEVLFQPGAGVLDPDATVGAMLELATASGHARVLTGWELTRIERTRGGITVHSAAGESITGSQLIIAAGGWLPELLDGSGLPAEIVAGLPPLQVRQEQAYHFPYRDPELAWPAVIHTTTEILAYALPGGRDADFRGQKVAQYNGGPVIRSAAERDGTVRAENRRRMTGYVRRHLPGLVPEPYAETTCLFTNTPTEDFVIDMRENVTILSACSGHGAKFAPLLGELAADLALGTGTVPDAFRLPRAGYRAPGRS